MNVAAMVEEVARAVSVTVSRSIAPIQRQIDDLIAWRKAVGEIRNGVDGAKGEPGVAGKDGAPGINGKDAPQVDIEQVVSKVLALVPTPKDGARGSDGRDGRDGTDGKDGAKGEPGLNGKDGADGINGRDGADGARGADGLPGEIGPAGKDGRDGKDGERGEKGEPGLNGKDGNGIVRLDHDIAKNALDVVMDNGDTYTLSLPVPQRGERGEKGESGLNGKDGRDGVNGKDGADGLNGKDGRDGIDGKNGADGLNGKDGAPGQRGEKGDVASPDDIAAAVTKACESLLPALVVKQYETSMPEIIARASMLVPPGRDGLPGRPGTPGEDGRDGVGIESVDITTLGDRKRQLIVMLSDGTAFRKEVEFDGMVLDRDVYRTGVSYEKGDAVTYAGSYWIAKRDTKDSPKGSDDWRLVVKKGRDGKDADALDGEQE